MSLESLLNLHNCEVQVVGEEGTGSAQAVCPKPLMEVIENADFV